MARVAPLPLESLSEPLRATIAQGQATRMLSSTLPVQIWARRPAVANAWLGTMAEIHERGVLPERLRELVRLKIASITNCPVCQVARKSDEVSEADIMACSDWSDPRFSPPEQAALRFAGLFAGDYLSIGDEIFDHLRDHFSEDQIVELHLFSGLMLAGGRMTYVLKGYEDKPD